MTPRRVAVRRRALIIALIALGAVPGLTARAPTAQGQDPIEAMGALRPAQPSPAPDVAFETLDGPLWLDPSGDLPAAFGVHGHPSTILIDRQGRIVARLPGERNWRSPEARRLVEWLLEQR